MISPAGRNKPGRALLRGGWTLVELLLALTLLVAFSSIMVIALPNLQRTASLDHGVDRFETLLRMARAEAANQGRRLRLSFDAEEGRPSIEWEFDPLGSPGQYLPYEPAWVSMAPADLVRVLSCRLTGTSQYLPGDDEEELTPIVFYPDGSCDWAELSIVSTDERDTRTALVEINGLTGVVTTRIVSAGELEEMQ